MLLVDRGCRDLHSTLEIKLLFLGGEVTSKVSICGPVAKFPRPGSRGPLPGRKPQFEYHCASS